MSTPFRGIPPRILQRQRDNQIGRFPTIARTGEIRTGLNVDAFDDVRTIVFTDDQTKYPIIYPQKLPINSVHIDSTLDPTGFSSAIIHPSASLFGTVRAGISDELVEHESAQFPYTPYNDTNHPEQDTYDQDAIIKYIVDNDLVAEYIDFIMAGGVLHGLPEFRGPEYQNNFWLVGTDPVDTAPGFSRKLADKTQIKLSLPITANYTMAATTASMVYYNGTAGTYELAGGTDAYTNPGALGQPWLTSNFPLYGIDITTWYTDGSNQLTSSVSHEAGAWPSHPSIWNCAGADAKLFGPFGNVVMSGSNQLAGASFTDPTELIPVNGFVSKLLTTPATYSPLLNSNFNATESQLIEIPGLQHPFLLEKIHVKMPICVGPGWIDDATRIIYLPLSPLSQFHTSGGLIQAIIDVGGPCVTFALQRQLASNRRELILSATIVPDGDCQARLNELVKLGERGIVQPTGAPDPGQNHTTAAGFTAFANPESCRVGGNDVDQFTGSISFTALAAKTNGVTAAQYASAGISSGSFTSIYYPSQFDDSFILGINPFGRSSNITPSGRSMFGKEYSVIDYSSNPQPTYRDMPMSFGRVEPSTTDVVSASLDVYHLQKTEASPYLLLPGDKLLLSISKYRSVSDPGAAQYNTIFSASDLESRKLGVEHDFTLMTGSIELTLYGSLIRERSEFHFERNESLTSLAIHESLQSNATCLDQFDLEDRTVFEGGIADSVIAGQLGVAGSAIINTRGILYSATNPTPYSSTGSLRRRLERNIVTVDSQEIYYDSITPSFVEIYEKIPGAQSYFINGTSFNVLYIDVASPSGVTQIGTDPTQAITGDPKWPKAFPFEPRYGDVPRNKNFFDPTIPAYNFNYNNGSGSSALSRSRREYSISVRSISGSSADLITLVANTPTPISSRTPPKEKLSRLIYGFGEYIYAGRRTGMAKPINQIATQTNGVTYDHRLYADVEIRGWRYGLKNGSPESSRAVWRRDHYGYFRDMLEQRQYSRYIQQKLLAPAVSVRFTLPDPVSTNSSNLSNAATSSLPYFEGTIRNRPAIVTTTLLQLDIP